MGKTFLLRLLALAADLDTSAELHLYDLKGGDLLPWKRSRTARPLHSDARTEKLQHKLDRARAAL